MADASEDHSAFKLRLKQSRKSDRSILQFKHHDHSKYQQSLNHHIKDDRRHQISHMAHFVSDFVHTHAKTATRFVGITLSIANFTCLSTRIDLLVSYKSSLVTVEIWKLNIYVTAVVSRFTLHKHMTIIEDAYFLKSCYCAKF